MPRSYSNRRLLKIPWRFFLARESIDTSGIYGIGVRVQIALEEQRLNIIAPLRGDELLPHDLLAKAHTCHLRHEDAVLGIVVVACPEECLRGSL